MTQPYRMTLATLLGLALLSSPALAFDKDHGKGRDRDDRKESRDRDRDRDHDRDGEPRGWSHGKKEGWKKSNCDLPPGLAKKNPNCGESRHEHRTVVITTPTARPRTTITRVPTKQPPTGTVRTTTKKTDDKIRNPADLILKRKNIQTKN